MRTSIVVPVHGKAALTTQCLDRLRPIVEARDDVEVIVVDDGSPDATQDLVSGEHPWVRLIGHERTQGFAAACNAGAGATEGEFLLFFNNDLAGEDGWLDALLTPADNHGRAGIVGCKLIYPNRTIQHAGTVICSDLLPRHVYRTFPADHPAVDRPRCFQAVTAACMLVRRALFEQAGGFDASFGNGFEDVDLCLRLNDADHEVHYCPASVLVHFEAATRGEDSNAFRRNAERYLARWGAIVKPDDIATYVADGLLRIVAGDVYPVELEVDPLLATVDVDGTAGEAFRLLGIRSRQVFDLLKENTVLRVRLGEVELEEARRQLKPNAAEISPFEA
jgi:GT2 family glycosyltransferase